MDALALVGIDVWQLFASGKPLKVWSQYNHLGQLQTGWYMKLALIESGCRRRRQLHPVNQRSAGQKLVRGAGNL